MDFTFSQAPEERRLPPRAAATTFGEEDFEESGFLGATAMDEGEETRESSPPCAGAGKGRGEPNANRGRIPNGMCPLSYESGRRRVSRLLSPAGAGSPA
ncbi:MAG TPA: hypothetical protein VFY16_11620, partial [Gemmatimonadaceae bacterium]|nr:hypothetical protein [Gemmatimonadaceae bacterium]